MIRHCLAQRRKDAKAQRECATEGSENTEDFNIRVLFVSKLASLVHQHRRGVDADQDLRRT